MRRIKKRKIIGTLERPRLSVFRSTTNIYAQVIDDLNGKTLAASSSLQLKIKNGGNVDAATKVGEAIAKAAVKNGVTKVVFDRGIFKYHGRVAALAKAAREGGLNF